MGKRIEKIVYTYGVFDLLHYGHLRALRKAKALGHKLVIGVFSDSMAENFKRRPILNEKTRLMTIKELELGDAYIQNTFLPTKKFLKEHSINIVAKAAGAGWSRFSYPKWEGIKSVLLPYSRGISTSKIINKIKCL
jgi:cytidyltransferase-like protein